MTGGAVASTIGPLEDSVRRNVKTTRRLPAEGTRWAGVTGVALLGPGDAEDLGGKLRTAETSVGWGDEQQARSRHFRDAASTHRGSSWSCEGGFRCKQRHEYRRQQHGREKCRHARAHRQTVLHCIPALPTAGVSRPRRADPDHANPARKEHIDGETSDGVAQH